jgi:NADH-ubiquinone oxidoreductase chain 5
MNHAFFKALLFLSAGSVIHALSDEQDMRKMGGIAQLLPFTYVMMGIGSLALIGFPFLTGFYSKDVILEIAYAKYTLSGNFAYWLGSLSALFTSYYSFRLLYLTFFGESHHSFTNSFKQSLTHTHDAPFFMAFPLIFLAFGSLFVGYLGKDMMIGLGTSFWGNALYTLPQNTLFLESEYIPQMIKSIPLFFSLFGAFLAYQINLSSEGLRRTYFFKTSRLGRNLYTFFNKRWLFDKVYNDFFVKTALSFGYQVSFRTLDKGMIEILGPYGIALTFQSLSQNMKKIQSGFIYHYAFTMLLGLTFLITLIGLWDFISFWIDNRLYFLLFISFLFLQHHKQ